MGGHHAVAPPNRSAVGEARGPAGRRPDGDSVTGVGEHGVDVGLDDGLMAGLGEPMPQVKVSG